MPRWMKNLIIAVYLGSCVYGLTIHTLKIAHFRTLADYFLVWDMYCGWNAFESRAVLLAEGESGQFYDVSPPWKPMTPYGSARRQDYDYSGIYGGRIALNTLQHTQHEPIRQIYLIEQIWSKKFNLPQAIWQKRFDEPRQPNVYYYTRTLFEPDGEVATLHYDWKSHLTYHSIIDNPALRATVAKTQPVWLRNTGSRESGQKIQQVSFDFLK